MNMVENIDIYPHEVPGLTDEMPVLLRQSVDLLGFQDS